MWSLPCNIIQYGPCLAPSCIWSLLCTIIQHGSCLAPSCIWSLPRTIIQYGPCLAPSCIWSLPHTIIQYGPCLAPSYNLVPAWHHHNIVPAGWLLLLISASSMRHKLQDPGHKSGTDNKAASNHCHSHNSCLRSMSYHAFATACCPVIPTLVSVLYLLPFVVSSVGFCAVHGSVPAGRHSLY